ncbi:septal ring lytic transglycosylase RlpA family protein [Altererythrobacter aerius]|uniref:Endolytic peptidoglycan transglycosylase RlpA n=2 Tax=Tsuneonella aeria TaxID=1837929 RepID=A0A6I4TAD5_9SPHN|nr:septal ring lytic transglycosylase RlpA family protein [Tsuneonella aeria]
MLPASASAPAFADNGAPPGGQGDDAFAASFSPINTAATAFVPAPGMVDVTAIEAPVEEAEPEAEVLGSGVASYYADKFNGRRTASGEAFSNSALTAAHRTLPFGTKLRVTNPANGKSVVVRINDRGPFHGNRVLDLSKTAAVTLGLVQRGSGRVNFALHD